MSQVSAMARNVISLASPALQERRQPAAAAGSVTPVLLLLDARGHVRFCSDADALQRSAEEIIGKPVTELIADLPLRRSTPGYNVAYVRFTYGDGARRPLTLTLPSGGTRPIDVGVEPLWMDRGYCLLVQLRFVCEAAESAEARAERQWGVLGRVACRELEIISL